MACERLRSFHIGAALKERRHEGMAQHVKRSLDRDALWVLLIGAGLRE
jgi:hypothetical protein